MIVNCDDDGIREAFTTIKKGGVIVFPTDTVYGVGCDPCNHDAVNRIYKIKEREKAKQLPVLGYSKKDIEKIAYFDELSERIVDKFWPGPVTLILRIKDKKIKESLDLRDKIAVRVPNHPCVLSLLKKCRLLVGTSANLSGLAPFDDSREILRRFPGYDLLLDGGKIPDSGESTIVEVVNNKLRILREGKVKLESLV